LYHPGKHLRIGALYLLHLISDVGKALVSDG
jgi:hypothetical protein